MRKEITDVEFLMLDSNTCNYSTVYERMSNVE